MARGNIILGSGGKICTYNGKIIIDDGNRLKIEGVPIAQWLAAHQTLKTKVVCRIKKFTYELYEHSYSFVSEVDEGERCVPSSQASGAGSAAILNSIEYYPLSGEYIPSSDSWERGATETLTLDNFTFAEYMRLRCYEDEEEECLKIIEDTHFTSIVPVGFVGTPHVGTSAVIQLAPVIEYYSEWNSHEFIESGERGERLYEKYEDTVCVAHVIWTFDFTRNDIISWGYDFWSYARGKGMGADSTFNGRVAIKCTSKSPELYSYKTSGDGLTCVYRKIGSDDFVLSTNGNYDSSIAQVIPDFLHGTGFYFDNGSPVYVPIAQPASDNGYPRMGYKFMYGKMRFPQITTT